MKLSLKTVHKVVRQYLQKGLKKMFIPSIVICVFDAFLAQNLIREFIEKVIKSRYICHFLIFGQIIKINITFPSIIGDFKELSAKLSIWKIIRKLSLSEHLTYRPPLAILLIYVAQLYS